MARPLSLFVLAILFPAILAADKEEQAKAALQELNDYIGTYKGLGGPDKPGATSKESWTEKLEWSWRFKQKDCWLELRIDKGKHFTAGQLRFLPDKNLY